MSQVTAPVDAARFQGRCETVRSPSPRANILGVGIDAYSMDQTLNIVSSAIESGSRGYVCATGVHGIMEAQKDPCLRALLNGAFLNLPDGRPTVWIGWLQGIRGMRQVTGPDFMLRACGMSVKKGYTHFLYGGNTGVAQKLKDTLETKFPGLKIVGTYTPPFRPFTPAEAAELSALVSRLKPDMFWVGLSTPKQERFCAEYLQKLETKLMFAVGAAFDIHIGKVNESPRWVKVIGMQWFHRLCQEPKRLWKRYLFNIPRFLVKIALQFAGFKKLSLAAPSSEAGAPHSSESFS